MRYSICSYSFHRTCAEGKMDLFSYIEFCRDFGCAELEPWNAHLSQSASGADALHAGRNPGDSGRLEPPGEEFLSRVKAAAQAAGLPFGCLAVDGAHIFDADPEKSAANRRRRFSWVDVAGFLGASSVRIDAGGPEEMPEAVFSQIVAGYEEIIAYARGKGVRVLIENHWGPSQHPEHLIRLLDSVDGLGLLFDSNNWARGKQAEGWIRCAPRACATHLKALHWAEDGEELNQHLGHVLQLLQRSGYPGVWGIESCPREVDEFEGVRRSKALLQKYLLPTQTRQGS